MARPQISPGERLYRGLLGDWVLKGGYVSPDAVNLQGMSVNREQFAKPESVLTAERKHVAYITPQGFPSPITLNEVAWEFISVDLPMATNEAHAEVRPHRCGDASTEARRPNSQEARRTLRARLAGRMKILDSET